MRKLLVGFFSLGVVLAVYILYTGTSDTRMIETDSGVEFVESVADSNVGDFEGNVGKIGDIGLGPVHKAYFINVNKETNALEREWGFEKLLHEAEGFWELEKPYVNVFESDFVCYITADRGLVQVETGKILKAAQVDFAILGEEETCNCEWARRAGEENLYQEATFEIIETLQRYKFNEILTQCPHCFNTFKNEYPQFDAHYEVVHHSLFIDQLVGEGRIQITQPLAETITYHDSCYMGRYNGEFDAPRRTLQAIPKVKLVEMSRSRRQGLCCGGGGAQVWMETEQKEPVSQIRLAEAMSLQPAAVGTACPFCKLMFDDAAGNMGVAEMVEIKDIAQLVVKVLE